MLIAGVTSPANLSWRELQGQPRKNSTSVLLSRVSWKMEPFSATVMLLLAKMAKNIIHKPLPGNSDLKDLLWTAEVVQKCRGDPKPKSWSTCTREVFQDWNTVLLWRACHNGNAIRNNQLAKQMRKVTPCTTEVKTWLPAVRYGAHLLLLQHGLRGNQGPCNYRCIETISPRSCGVNFWGWWERTP